MLTAPMHIQQQVQELPLPARPPARSPPCRAVHPWHSGAHAAMAPPCQVAMARRTITAPARGSVAVLRGQHEQRRGGRGRYFDLHVTVALLGAIQITSSPLRQDHMTDTHSTTCRGPGRHPGQPAPRRGLHAAAGGAAGRGPPGLGGGPQLPAGQHTAGGPAAAVARRAGQGVGRQGTRLRCVLLAGITPAHARCVSVPSAEKPGSCKIQGCEP